MVRKYGYITRSGEKAEIVKLNRSLPYILQGRVGEQQEEITFAVDGKEELDTEGPNDLFLLE